MSLDIHLDLKDLVLDNLNINNLINILVCEYYNTDLYKRNLALNLPHSFTTNELIYSETGVYGIEILDNKTDYIVYGNTDMLFIPLNTKFTYNIIDNGYRYKLKNYIYGIPLNYLTDYYTININIPLHNTFINFVKGFEELKALYKVLKNNNYKYPDINLYLNYLCSAGLVNPLFYQLLYELKQYYKDIYFVFNGNMFNYLISSTTVSNLNRFFNFLLKYNIKLCFYKNNYKIKFSNKLKYNSLNNDSKKYLNYYLSNVILCPYSPDIENYGQGKTWEVIR